MHSFSWLALLLVLAFCPKATAQDADTELTIPAFCGYAHPNPNAMRRDRKTGQVRWCDGELRFYVEFAAPGKLHFELDRLAGAPAQRLRLDLRKLTGKGGASLFEDAPSIRANAAVTFGDAAVKEAGSWCVAVSAADGGRVERLANLRIGGAGAAGAKASTVERRNAASVHLWYDVPKRHQSDIEWFYCELTPRTDPLWTYYMATGWHRGYFGMQVNSKTERRIIFSVWDSGSEAIDRNKVKPEDLVQLKGKGKDVYAGGFGNEGTGGHSHLVHDWQLGDTVRFVVRAQPKGTHTTYTGWFAHVHKDGTVDDWRLVASFDAPRDGKHLQGLYSFSENFSGANGDRDRQCDYGNVWLRTKAGEWLAVRRAKFTHDGHGDEHRLDRRGGVRGGRWFLQHGNFDIEPMRRGTALELPGETGAPPASLPHL